MSATPDGHNNVRIAYLDFTNMTRLPYVGSGAYTHQYDALFEKMLGRHETVNLLKEGERA